MRYTAYFFTILFILINSAVIGQQANTIELLDSKQNEISVRVSLNDFKLEEVQTDDGMQYTIVGDGLKSILEKGAPDLPKLVRSIIVPDASEMQVELVSSKFYDIENVEIVPSKGHFMRTQDPSEIPFTHGKQYKTDSFYPAVNATLNTPYILRDFRGQAIDIFPFQYNPITKTLRVHTEIKLSITESGNAGKNLLNRKKQLTSINKEFHRVYEEHFLNYKSMYRYIPIEEEGNMLIIAHDEYMTAMEPFIEWKTTIGLQTEIVGTSTTGTSWQNIQSYIADYYNDPINDLIYVLLVGDAQHIPPVPASGTSVIEGYSDNFYGYLEGADRYQEIFIGRFSAESVADVETQVQRTMEYEQATTLPADWLNVGLGLARKEGAGSGHDGGEADDFHMENIRDRLLNYNYVSVHQEYDGGSSYVSSNTTAADITSRIEDGVGVINFCNHGNWDSWSVGGYHINHVNALTNIGKLPFVWSVACIVGQFQGQTSFAESWLRATHNGEPTGALAHFGSTINQPWHPPMDAQDEFNRILTQMKEGNVKRSFGGISINGVFDMLDKNNDSYGHRTAETWTIFGDPSVKVRTDNPADFALNHADVILFGTDIFTITLSDDDAFGVFTYDGEIISSGSAVGGEILLDISEVLPGQELTLAITGYNKIPYIVDLLVIAPEGPYVVADNINVEGENTIDFGQSNSLQVTLKNVGPDLAENVQASLTTADEFVVGISDNLEISFGDIAGDDGVSTVSDMFIITVADNVPNGHNINFTLIITDNNDNEWISNFNIKANAPVLSIGDMVLDDSLEGNGDGVLDPGETADLKIAVTNTGNADVTNISSLISSFDTELIINTEDVQTTSSVLVGDTYEFTFNISADAETGLGTVVSILNEVTAGESNQYSAEKDFSFVIGFVPEYCVSSATNTIDSDLTGVVFGDLENLTAPGSTYDDFTETPELIHEFVLGETYDIGITLGTAGGTYTKGAKVFIDWNYNGNFDDEGETVFVVEPQNDNWTATGTVTIPADAPLGQKFMRIVVQETSNTDNIQSCGTYNWGGTEDYKIILVAPQPPIADFQANPTVTVENDIVSFTDISVNAPNHWQWTISPGIEGEDFEFVNSTGSESKNPQVRFSSADQYSVELTVTNSLGQDTEIKTNYITITELTEAPVANFTADATTINLGGVVSFTDLSANVPTAWEWTITPGSQGVNFNFIEGTTEYSQNPKVEFLTPGLYSVELIASNNIGTSEPFLQDDLIEVLAVFTMTDADVYACSGLFYDTGGPDSDYQNNENYTMTFYPDVPGNALNFQFTEFNVEANIYSGGCYDFLKVYDGANTSATLIGNFCGTTVPAQLQDITATNPDGALTFVFSSDGLFQSPGWKANISCVSYDTYSVSGYLSYFDQNATPLEGVEISMIEQTRKAIAETDPIGFFEIHDVAEGTYEIAPTVNLPWQGVTAMDITAYKKHIGQQTGEILSDFAEISGDVDGDGKLTVLDLRYIRERLLGNIDAFPIDDWIFFNTYIDVSDNLSEHTVKAGLLGDARGLYYSQDKAMKEIQIVVEDNLVITDNSDFEIPVKTRTGLNELASISMEIRLNDSGIGVNNVRAAQKSEEMHFSIIDNVIRIVFSSIEPVNIAAGQELLFIEIYQNSNFDNRNVIKSAVGEFGTIQNTVINNVQLSVPAINGVTGMFDQDSEFTLYPNPANLFINVIDAENAQIDIMNTLGKTFISKNIDSNHFKIDVSELAAGTYFVKIQNREYTETRKLIIIN